MKNMRDSNVEGSAEQTAFQPSQLSAEMQRVENNVLEKAF